MRCVSSVKLCIHLSCLCALAIMLGACDLANSSPNQAANPSATAPTATATTPPTVAPTATHIPSCATVSSGTKPLTTSQGAVTFDFVSGAVASGATPQVSVSFAASAITVTGINGVKLAEVADILTCQQLHQVQYTETTVTGTTNSAVLIALKTQQHDLVFALISPQSGGDVSAQWTTYTP